MKTVDVLSAYAEEDESEVELENNADGTMTLQIPSEVSNPKLLVSEPSTPAKKGKHGHGHGHAHGGAAHQAESEHADTTIVDPQCQHGHSHEVHFSFNNFSHSVVICFYETIFRFQHIKHHKVIKNVD